MKKVLLVVLFLSCLANIEAQEFIGCRTDSGWAETPMLRKSFTINAEELERSCFPKSRFTVDVTSLGYHEVYINGKKVGDCVMQPAVSQLDKRALTVTYDITDYVHDGENEIMLWIGQGWGRIYGTPASVSAAIVANSVSLLEKVPSVSQLDKVSDGECDQSNFIVWTDSTWEASPSPYSYTGSWQPLQFGGERYDARLQPDWQLASVFTVANSVSLLDNNLRDADGYNVSRQEFGGNHIVDILEPFATTEQDDGSLLLDFGRVATGWFKAVFPTMPEGTEVSMEYLDHIDAKPPHTEKDIYIAHGNGEELFCNRFHTHSFRYVRISVLPRGMPASTDGTKIMQRASLNHQLSTFNFLVISAIDPTGGATFECNDERLNAIHNMVKYTLSCLTHSGYMVDCPHLERMGYGGDGNSSTMTLQTIWDVRDTYRNWMTAWGDAMQPDGELPYVAPAFRTGGGPYWSSFIIQAPWRTYLNYGDQSLIVEYYSKMKRWLEYIERNIHTPSPLRGTPPSLGGELDGLLHPWPDNERHAWFLGDWLAPSSPPSSGVLPPDKGENYVDIRGESVLHVNNCVISECLADMEQIANVLYLEDDALYYAGWRQKLNSAIHRAFYHPETHTYGNGTPLDQAYALLMGIPPDRATAAAVRSQLLKDCHGKYRDHVAFGLVGVPIFTKWCICERQTDLMATILRQPDYPGYLNMINNGATTTWESWDCGRPGKEDRSRVHNCYNGVGTWFYQALAGIRPDPEQPGYKHFFIDPQTCDGITQVKATKPTLYGTISVEIDGMKLKIDVPNGTTATVFPDSPSERTLSSGVWELDINADRGR